jgi:hypothetical protein
MQAEPHLRRQQQEGDERDEATAAPLFDESPADYEEHSMSRLGTIWITITGSQGGDKFPGLLMFRRGPTPRPGREIG